MGSSFFDLFQIGSKKEIYLKVILVSFVECQTGRKMNYDIWE